MGEVGGGRGVTTVTSLSLTAPVCSRCLQHGRRSCSCFSESLIRTAFQCLQLVVTDFLPTMPCTCLQIVVEVAGSFGLQNQELNISLTSIGLLVRGQ